MRITEPIFRKSVVGPGRRVRFWLGITLLLAAFWMALIPYGRKKTAPDRRENGPTPVERPSNNP